MPSFIDRACSMLHTLFSSKIKLKFSFKKQYIGKL